jgi:hypothetical protein
MLRHIRRLYTTTFLQSAIDEGKVAVAPRNVPFRDTRYRVHVASILVRNPVILRPITEFEAAYEQYREELQGEYSRGVFDIMTSHKREVAKLAGGTVKEASIPEFPLHEEYVRANEDPTSLMRKLERKLYYVIQADDGRWAFPSMLVQFADMPLHKCARRMLERTFGADCELYHIGCSPIAFHKESMPDRSSPPLGTKTFFFKSQLVGGTLNFTESLMSRRFAWLSKEELQSSLPASYYTSVEATLTY